MKRLNSFSKNYLDLDSLELSDKEYDGTSNKRGVIYQGSKWFIKFNKKSISESFSEYVASNIFRILGVECQETLLGKIDNEPTVLIKDFTNEKCILHSFNDVNQSSEDTLIENKEYTYDEVVYLIEQNNKLSDNEKIKCINQIWDMFIIDAILGNRDRHKGNWGYLKFRYEDYCTHAPVFDNNGSLFPGISKYLNETNFKITNEFLAERSDYFPASKFKIFDGSKNKKINYYELFRGNDLPEIFYKRLRLLLDKFYNGNFINKLEGILENELIPNNYREFYFKIVLYRIGRIILDNSYGNIEKGVDYLWRRSSLRNHLTQ